MITYIDKDNAVQYTALFAKASEAYNSQIKRPEEPSITINTLEQYFYYLPDLMTLKKEGSEYGLMLGRRYAMLPVNEDVFLINANTRQIEVPKVFQQNGIGVQGDEVAEIIYFKIDRYFDFMDLNNAEIYIQWENSKGKQVSQEWVRDIESDPDHLIFGWALDSNVTAEKGVLKFSVRFVTFDDEGKINYSFSTMETSAQIKEALNIQIAEIADDIANNNLEINEMILNRIKRSTVVGADKADTPEYTLSLLQWIQQNEGTAQAINTVDLVDGKYPFKVQAFTPDAGTLEYTWKKDNSEKLNNTPLYELVPYDVVDGETMDYVTAKPNHIYYIKNEDGEGYTILNVNPNTQITKPCYELYGSYEATTAGSYTAIAVNRLKFDTAEASSGPVIIPGPVAAGCSPNGGKGAEYILSVGNNYTTTIFTTPINNDIAGTDDKYTYNYQWYKNGKETENKISSATAKDLKVVGDSVYTDVQGKYYLETIAIRNNSPVSSFSEPFLVTYAADTFNIKLVDQANQEITSIAYSNDTIYAKLEFDHNYQISDLEFEKLSYKWYTIDKEGRKTEIPQASGNSLYLDGFAGSAIACQVINEYNGSTTSAESAQFTVRGA